jgi:hypothetical protein
MPGYVCGGGAVGREDVCLWGAVGSSVLTLLFLSVVGCCCRCWLLLLVLSLPPWSLQVQSVMTARQLLSILRLSQALARLRFSRRVELEDVEEAIRLVHMCKASLLEDDTFTGEDPTTRIYSLIRDYAIARGKNCVNYAEIERTLLTKGFTQGKAVAARNFGVHRALYTDIGVFYSLSLMLQIKSMRVWKNTKGLPSGKSIPQERKSHLSILIRRCVDHVASM